MCDFNIKKTALQVLVANEILTEEELELCLNVLKNQHNIADTVSEPFDTINRADYIYDDSMLSLEYKGLVRIKNVFQGEGYAIKFVVHNKTQYKLQVLATEISVNGFVVEDFTYIAIDIPPNRKTIDSANIYDKTLNDCGIYDISDMHRIEFRVKYEIESIDYECKSDLILLFPCEA